MYHTRRTKSSFNCHASENFVVLHKAIRCFSAFHGNTNNKKRVLLHNVPILRTPLVFCRASAPSLLITVSPELPKAQHVSFFSAFSCSFFRITILIVLIFIITFYCIYCFQWFL